MIRFAALVACLPLALPVVAGEPAAERPAEWAAPLAGQPGLENLYRVSDGLYRGARPDDEGYATLKAMGIKTLVNLRLFSSGRKQAEAAGLDYVRIKAEAWDPDEDEVVAFLKVATDPERQPVFVHCKHGADRTGMMVAVYRIVVQGWSREDALREMTEGGYGFHSVFKGLVDYVEELDVAALRAQVRPADCPPADGLEPLLKPGHVLLLGELHGTVEMPEFAGRVACHATAAGLPVVVGLELLPEAATAVEAFLESPDRDRLLAGRQWTRSYQDGRTSRAMVELLERLARLRADGRSARVVLFDAQPAAGGQARERAMAAHLAKSIAAAPKAFHVVLTGDVHSRTSKGGRGGADYEPMGHVLARIIGAERVTALKASHAGGSAWICSRECGAVTVGGRGSVEPGTIEIDEKTRPAGHHGWYGVGSLTASTPAVGDHEIAIVERDFSPIALPPEPDAGFPEQTAELLAPWQGSWQAWQYGTKAWTIEIEAARFRGVGGADDGDEGGIRRRPERQPAEIDFLIEDCRCDYRGMVSRGIFRMDGKSILLAAPQPGLRRPTGFNPGDGRTVELRRK